VRLVEGDPIEALASGEARLAAVGAEHFFRATREGEVRRDDRAVAVAVLGVRLGHLLRPPGASGAPASVGHVGRDSGSARVAGWLFPEGVKLRRYKSLEALLEAARSGAVDAALVMAPQADPALLSALAGGGLVPTALAAPGGTDLAWLRPARLPAGTYPGQDRPVETLSAQLVIAGAAAQSEGLASGGPAAALPTTGQPLSWDEAEAVLGASSPEVPDPVVPSFWTAPHEEEVDPVSVAAETLGTSLNVLVLAFLVWLVTLALRPMDPPDSAGEGG
jgi:hypothetical protein